MKKGIYFFVFIASILFILFNSEEIIENIKFSFDICFNNLFPSLIPFMLFSNILLNYKIVSYISEALKNVMTKLFKVNKNCSFIFIMSIISGSPSNAKYISDLFRSNMIELQDCIDCLNFCHFVNPIFVINTVGITFLSSKNLGIIILISHYLSSILIGISNKKRKLNSKSSEENKTIKKSFIEALTNSINSTIDTLLLILGIITTCLIITSMINKIINLDSNFKFLYGIIEITQGLKYLSMSNINIILKAVISSFLISFGGICIHMQVFSILNNKKIKYKPYFISRIIHAILSSSITYILILIFSELNGYTIFIPKS